MQNITTRIVILQFAFLLGLVWFPMANGPRGQCAGSDEDLYRLGSTHYARGQWDFAVKRFETLIVKGQNRNLVALSRFYLAESYVALKDFHKALGQLKLFLENNPEHPFADRARFRFGEISYLLGDSESAFENLRQYAANNPDHPLMQYALPYLGEMELKKGNLHSAATFFQESLQKNPNGILANEARFGLARTLEKNKSTTEAIRFYQYLVNHPESSRVADSLLQLGKIHFRQNNLNDAKKAFSRFDSEFADHELANPVRYWQGRIHYRNKDFITANAYFKKALANNPQPRIVPALKYELARSLAEQEKFSHAISHLKVIIKEHPQSDWADDALLLNIQILQNSRQFQLASRLCQQFHQLYSASPLVKHVLISEAECLFASKHYSTAKNALTSLLTRYGEIAESGSEDMRRVQAWKYKLAVCEIKRGKTSNASSILQSIEMEECDETIKSAAVLTLATIQIERNQLAQATKSLVSFVESNQDSTASRKCVIDIALLLGKRNNFQQADEWLSKIKDQHDKTETCLQLAEIAFADQQFVFASQWFSKAANLAADAETKSRAMMGNVWALKESGNIGNTVAAADRLIASLPRSQQAPEALFLKAVLLEKSGEKQRAMHEFEQLAKNYSTSKHLEKTLLSLGTLYREIAKEKLVDLIDPLSRLISNSKSQNRDSLLYELAWVLKETSNPQASIKRFQELRSSFPKSEYRVEATLQLATLEANHGNVDRARDLYQTLESTVDDPAISPLASYQLGKIAFDNKDFSDAYKHMNHIVENYPGSSVTESARFWAAESKYRYGDYPAAATLFRVIQTLTESKSTYQNRILLRLGQISIKTEKWNTALEIVNQLKTKQQDEIPTWELDFICGRSNSGLGLFSKARTAYEKVLTAAQAKGTETAAMAQWMIGESHFHQENFESAIDAYQRAEILHAYPQWQAASLLQAGKCFEQLNRPRNAIENYRRIVSGYANSRFAKDARNRLIEMEELTTSLKTKKRISR